MSINVASSGITINGAKLRAARQRLRWSTSQLADALGCSSGHVRLMERGLRRPSIALVGQLEQVLSTTAEELEADLPPAIPPS